jgi:hypothetical protein
MFAHLRLAGCDLPHLDEKLQAPIGTERRPRTPTGGIVHPLGRFASAGLISRGLAGSNGQERTAHEHDGVGERGPEE